MKRVELEKSVLTGREVVELMEEASLSMELVASNKTSLRGEEKEKEIERLEHLHHVLLHALRDKGLEKVFETYKQSTEDMLALFDMQGRVRDYEKRMERVESELRSSRVVLESKSVIVIL